MAFSIQGTTGTDTPVQSEQVLMETINRIGSARSDYQALRIHLSELQPHNRSPSYLRIANYMATRISRSAGAEAFQLPNNDIIIIGKDVALTDLETIVSTIRALFARDPLSFSDSGDGQDKFCTSYSFVDAYDTFKNDVFRILRENKTEVGQKNATSPRLDSKALDEVIEAIRQFDLSPVIRRQTALQFDQKNISNIAFEEYFVSMADLPNAITIETNLISSRWLFLYLSAHLDHHMLDWFSDVRLQRKKAPLSLNLNIESLFTPIFRGFEERLTANGLSLVVELQMPDVFADLGTYFFARDWLHERGHQVLLDGVRPTTMQLTNIGLLKTDMIKLLWTPRLVDSYYGKTVAETLRKLDLAKIVLAHCDSEQAILWGNEVGVSCFQGNFIDTMLAAVTMRSCSKGENCTLRQCTYRRSLLAGRARLECENVTMLDFLPSLQRPTPAPPNDSGTES